MDFILENTVNFNINYVISNKKNAHTQIIKMWTSFIHSYYLIALI